MNINTKRLTTPFDLHATFKDLLNTTKTISNAALVNRELEFYSSNRGISLFLPIPLNRTCPMAGIDDHWCICWSKTPVANASTDKDVQDSVNFTIHQINSKLKPFPMCSQLKLDSIMLARKLNPEST